MGMEKIKSFFLCGKNLIKRYTSWYVGLYKNSKWYKKAGIGIISFFIAFLLLLGAIDMNFLWLFGKSPSMFNIANPVQAEASEIYSCDGQMMGKFFKENRSPVEYKDISPILIKTLVCTEDERFYGHFGIDVQGLFSAAKDIMQGKKRGASTITQQLVKNMFKVRSQYSKGLFGHIPGVGLVIMKFKEWISAVKIEMRYNKDEIITMYLNTVDFGSNAYGIKTASRTFFQTTPRKLNYEQSATLVGLLKATSYYNPRINPNNSLERRNVVLGNMLSHEHINKAQYDSLCALPIDLKYEVETNYDGKALYFRDAVCNEMKDTLKSLGYDIYSDGLKIYTSLDSRLQVYAERSVIKKMRSLQRTFNRHWDSANPWQNEAHEEIPGFIENIAKHTDYYRILNKKFKGDADSIDYYLNLPHKMKVFEYQRVDGRDTTGRVDTVLSTMDSIRYMVKFMHCSFLVMDPHNGQVKAWVGDVDFNSWKYDKVTAKRQSGSTFKIFDYTEAMKQGMSPCDEREDSYIAWEVWDKAKGKRVNWAPHNADGYFSGQTFSLKAAFARSLNSIAVKISQEVGIPNINRTAHEMGIKSPLNDTVPATCLGASDVSLLELVNSYCTVINEGVTHEPVLVTKVVNRDGEVIYKAPNTDKKVLDYEVAFLMREMLRGGLTEVEGTTAALWSYIHPVLAETDFGGKTGTSSNHSDAWFVGITPNLVAGCWVGGEYRSIHFRTGELGQGSRTALPVFGYFVQDALQDPALAQYRGRFQKPKQKITREYNCQRYYRNTLEGDSLSTDSLDVEFFNSEAPPETEE